MAKKRVAAIVKIQIPAGKATPAPPVGTALGPHGIAIMDFVKAYNAATEAQVGTVVPVEITVFEDRSFTFVLKTPPTPVLIREKAGIPKASSTPGKPDHRHDQRGRRRRHRQDQDARPQRQRPRGCQAAGSGHRPIDGHQGRLVSQSPIVSQSHIPRSGPGRPRPGDHTPPRETSCPARSTPTP